MCNFQPENYKSTNLNKYSKVYDYQSRSDKHFLPGEKGQRQQKREREASCSADAAVEDDALVLAREGEGPEPVADGEEREHAWGTGRAEVAVSGCRSEAPDLRKAIKARSPNSRPGALTLGQAP